MMMMIMMTMGLRISWVRFKERQGGEDHHLLLETTMVTTMYYEKVERDCSHCNHHQDQRYGKGSSNSSKTKIIVKLYSIVADLMHCQLVITLVVD